MIRSKPYYWIQCDHPAGRPFSSGCEARCPDACSEHTAWSEEDGAIAYAEESGWQQRGDLWFCPEHAIEEKENSDG